MGNPSAVPSADSCMFWNFLTFVRKMPMHSTSPSSLLWHMSCVPTQIPSTGCVRVGMKVSSPRSASLAIAVDASPTPGSITLSACVSSALSSVYIHSVHPTRAKALVTERMFPVS